MAETTIGLKNLKKPAPKWLRKLKRVVNTVAIPVAVTTIKGLWVGSDVGLNRVLLIITATLPGVLEILAMVLANGEDYTESN